MKVLGIDQSYTKCAVVLLTDWQLIIDTDYTIARVELFKKTEGKDRFEQAHNISKLIMDVCLEEKPDFIGIEGLAFGSVGNATRDLAGLQYVITTDLRYRAGYDNKIEIYDPRTIKKFATGRGNAKKPEMYEALPENVKHLFSETLGLKKTTGREDTTDAYYIARYMMEIKNADIQS